jgi:Na+/melibiose symporter-like transporter
MISLLIFYIIPFIICCVVGYHFSIKNKETWRQYFIGVLLCLLPIVNIIIAVFIVCKFFLNTQTGENLINNLTTFLDKPVK